MLGFMFLQKNFKNPDFRLSHSRKLLPFSLISCIYSYSLHRARIDVAGGRVYHVWDILRKSLGDNFVPGPRTSKPTET